MYLYRKGLWFMWRGRNDSILNNAPAIPGNIVCSRTNNPTCLIWVYWTPPNYGYLKQSIDGSSIQNPGYPGLSGVFHNWMGEFVLGYERAIHVISKMTAEMWALRDGL